MKVSLKASLKLVASVDHLDLIVIATKGGFMLFVRKDIPVKLIFFEILPTKGFYVGINLGEQKWLLCCSYNTNIHNVFTDFYSNYENFPLMGDLNASLDNAVLKDFYNLHNLKSLIKKATFYKSLINPSCTDLLLTNSPTYFQNLSVIVG